MTLYSKFLAGCWLVVIGIGLAGCKEEAVANANKTPEERYAQICSEQLQRSMVNPDSFKLIDAKFHGRFPMDASATKIIMKKYQGDELLMKLQPELYETKTIDKLQAVIVAEGTNSFGAVRRDTYLCDAFIPSATELTWSSAIDSLFTMNIDRAAS